MNRFRTTTYQIVTDDPEAQKRAAFGDDYRRQLEQIGFTFLGLLKATSKYRIDPGLLQQTIPGSDGEMVAETTVHGEIHVLLISPDKRAFASVENYFGEPILSIRTMLEDGTVVETTIRPRHTHKRADLIGNPQRMTGLMMSALMNTTVGPGAVWPRANRPQARYFVTLLDTESADGLWQHHQQKIEQVNIKNQAAVRGHISVTFYICICQRYFMIIEHRGRLNWIITNFLFVLFFIGAIVLIPTTLRLASQYQWSIPMTILVGIILVLVMGGLTMLLRTAAIRYIVQYLPGPDCIPASTLSHIIQSMYRF